MRRKNKQSKIIALVFAIALIGLGYAYLTTNLKVKGTTNIGNTRWDVHFENAKLVEASDTVTYPSNSNSNVEEGDPIIVGEAKQEIVWTAIFNAPGDYYSFDSDVVNAGDIDAQLDYRNSFVKLKVGNDDELRISLDQMDEGYQSFSSHIYDYNAHEYVDVRPEGLPEYIKYKIDYNNRKLHAGEKGYVYCEVGIDESKISNEEWANLQGKEIKMSLELKFVQDDGSADWEPNIIFENPIVNSNGTNTSVVPNITNGKESYYSLHKVSYDVVFNNPGDYYEFTVDIRNYADWGAFVYFEEGFFTIGDGEKTELYDNPYSSSRRTLNLPEGLTYSVENFGPFYTVCQLDTRRVKVRIGLDSNISEANLNALRGKNIKFEYRFESDSGRDSGSIGRCPARHDYY